MDARLALKDFSEQVIAVSDLRRAILAGDLAAGLPAPSERELIDRYGVARGTVWQAMALLRSEGLIEIEHGRGTFVRRRPPVRRLGHDRFARGTAKRGRRPSSLSWKRRAERLRCRCLR